MRHPGVITLGIAACLTVIWLGTRAQPARTPPAPKAETRKVPLSVTPVLEQEAWGDKLDKDDIDALMERFHPGKRAFRPEFSAAADVRLGQTLVTDMYEAGSGTFVLSRLTPKLINGGKTLAVDVSTQSLDVGGGLGKISDYPIHLNKMPGGEWVGAMIVASSSGDYRIDVRAKEGAAKGQYAFQTAGSYSNKRVAKKRVADD